MNILVDTNILVYAVDPADPVRQEKAIQILEHLHLHGNGRLCAQCLAEFFCAVTRSKRSAPPRLTIAESLNVVTNLAAHFETFPLTTLTVLEAGRGVRDHRLSYFDAQIWAAARLNQTLVVFSEDFQHGQSLEGVQFIDPFKPQFDLAAWR